MTIIKPSVAKKHFRFLLLIFAIFFAAGMFYIYQYNRLVATNHSLADLEKSLAAEQMRNADLKTAVYQLTNPEILRQTAAEYGLILENKPGYFQVDRWPSVSLR